jgi:hypothetical protein
VNGVLREANHLRPLVDEQLAKSKRGTGSQCGAQDADRFVVVAGSTETVRELQRRAEVGTGAVVLIDAITASTGPRARFIQGRRCPGDQEHSDLCILHEFGCYAI